MKKLLCKFANWILRKCLNPIISYNDKVYINGKEYTFSNATSEMSRHAYTIINLEVIDGDPRW
jgi:hypothetical protein